MKLFKLTVATGTKVVNVVAADEAEAKTKFVPAETEKLVEVKDEGEVVA